MTADLNFVVVDVDSGTPLADRQAYAAAQQAQLREDFAPLWDGLGESSCVRAATPDAPPLAGEVEIRLLKNAPADQAGALAYHDRQADGTPICYVFVGLIESTGSGPWTSAASHEVLETMGDAWLNDCVQAPDGTIWAREICDACEAVGYPVNGVMLSDFTTPAYWSPKQGATAGKLNFLGTITAPFAVLPGGYMQKFDPSSGWSQVQASRISAYRTALSGLGMSRGSRRAKPFHKSWWARLLNRIFSR